MRPLYLLILIISLTGCGELEGQREFKETKIPSPKTNEQYISNDDFSKLVKEDLEKEDVKIVIKPRIKHELGNTLANQGLTQDFIKRSENFYPPIVSVYDLNLDDGFKYVGQYVEDGCLTKMHKKKYQVTDLYIHVDCKGKRSKYNKDK